MRRPWGLGDGHDHTIDGFEYQVEKHQSTVLNRRRTAMEGFHDCYSSN
ncbi:MAG: hypothetical protein JRF07_07210 [Deltaproteobacteria bacterium]|nr:hypothetical protein [Deltaproteobacteria bacterium]